MLLVESKGQIFRRNLALAGVHHFHITAQRKRRQAPIDIAPALGIKGFAEPDRKTQYLDAAPARHQKMSQFMQADQQQDGSEKGQQGIGERQDNSKRNQIERLKSRFGQPEKIQPHHIKMEGRKVGRITVSHRFEY